MRTITAFYREWTISAVPLGEEWTNRCLPPGRNTICTDWGIYDTAEAALSGAQEYIDRAAAMYALAEGVLELYEAEKINSDECQSLLRSLGYG
jgi:hypothetical protein